MRHLLTLADVTAAEIERIFSITEDLKQKCEAGLREPLLPGRVMALVFEKPSLRTRSQLRGGHDPSRRKLHLLRQRRRLRAAQSIADFARVLGEYADVVVIRANRHQTAVELSEHCTCSVVNGLTDFGHPCQALADLYTMRELVGKLEGHTLAWIGDANNVARSVAVGCGKLGIRMVMATPKKHQFDEKSLVWIRRQAPKLDFSATTDPVEAVRDAVAVYTDVWASMGQESQQEERRREFAAYQVNAELMKHAQKGAFFLHCLPAHRGEEVTDEVIDGPQSVVIQQAANRMHVQKGVLAWLLGAQG